MHTYRQTERWHYLWEGGALKCANPSKPRHHGGNTCSCIRKQGLGPGTSWSHVVLRVVWVIPISLTVHSTVRPRACELVVAIVNNTLPLRQNFLNNILLFAHTGLRVAETWKLN
jgi:hypothetical protein